MEKGIPVLDLIPGCHAERAGVKVGDQILKVNGQEINDIDDYVNAAALEKHTRTLVVLRNEVLIDIEMIVGPPTAEGIAN